jgi:outer membrane usher protein FimD/PapC
VAAVGMFGVKDKIIVSVKTDAATPANAAIDAKLTFQDGQVAGQQTATVVAGGVDTTNIEFTNANAWPAGKYKVDVTLNGQPVGMTQEIEVK